MKEEFKQAKIFGLRILGRYVGSRIHGEEDNNDFGYVDILEKMTEEMFDIPEEYFQKDGIEFLVVKESNLYLKKFLKKYSEWEKIKKDWHSDIENQLILSTHSPYLLSDILPSNVFLLERSGVERQLSVQRMDKMNGNSCFGANVYDLMKNQFFMENTVGEFATKKLNNLARKIEELGRLEMITNQDDKQRIKDYLEML